MLSEKNQKIQPEEINLIHKLNFQKKTLNSLIKDCDFKYSLLSIFTKTLAIASIGVILPIFIQSFLAIDNKQKSISKKSSIQDGSYSDKMRKADKDELSSLRESQTQCIIAIISVAILFIISLASFYKFSKEKKRLYNLHKNINNNIIKNHQDKQEVAEYILRKIKVFGIRTTDKSVFQSIIKDLNSGIDIFLAEGLIGKDALATALVSSLQNHLSAENRLMLKQMHYDSSFMEKSALDILLQTLSRIEKKAIKLNENKLVRDINDLHDPYKDFSGSQQSCLVFDSNGILRDNNLSQQLSLKNLHKKSSSVSEAIEYKNINIILK